MNNGTRYSVLPTLWTHFTSSERLQVILLTLFRSPAQNTPVELSRASLYMGLVGTKQTGHLPGTVMEHKRGHDGSQQMINYWHFLGRLCFQEQVTWLFV
jgi:hypothetical protein